ncbi:MAG: ATP-binding cassette domain-containing protein [Roseburia sp.]|nr:ATP-binding cassette domain-containing protein [Roseburia sp.]
MISVRDLSSQYGDTIALQNVSFDLAEGDFLTIFGGDDAGKTTLLRILMGFRTRYSGTVKLWGKRPNRLTREQQSRLRFLPDDIIWEGHLTGEEYLSYIQRCSEVYDGEYQEELCRRFGVVLEEGLLDTSYQNNKLVQMIGALCVRPKLILLDEPSTYLETEVYRILCELLQEHCRQGGGVLVTEKSYETAREYSSRCIYLKEGKIAVNARVTHPDIRCKAVTVRGGQEEYLNQYLSRFICERKGTRTYLYKGDMKTLAALMYHAECADWIVEELTLTEELEGNYARWK